MLALSETTRPPSRENIIINCLRSSRSRFCFLTRCWRKVVVSLFTMPDEADTSVVQALRILHIEDSEADSLLVQQKLLHEGLDCQVDRVETREQFEQALRQNSFDLILADCKLPRFSGLEALSLARAQHPHIPFVFLSGTIGEEAAIESLRNGATDYVLKDRLSRLVPPVMLALTDTKNRANYEEMEKRLREAQRLEAIGTPAGRLSPRFYKMFTNHLKTGFNRHPGAEHLPTVGV